MRTFAKFIIVCVCLYLFVDKIVFWKANIISSRIDKVSYANTRQQVIQILSEPDSEYLWPSDNGDPLDSTATVMQYNTGWGNHARIYLIRNQVKILLTKENEATSRQFFK